jgi:hypothetical protein
MRVIEFRASPLKSRYAVGLYCVEPQGSADKRRVRPLKYRSSLVAVIVFLAAHVTIVFHVAFGEIR